MPYIGNSPGTGTRNRFIYTATASQTTFSGADDNGKTLKYSDSDYVDVYLNGICLVPVTDYTSTSKTSIVLTQAASLNDTLEVVAYDIATISDTVSKADGGTFEGDIKISTTSGPQLSIQDSDNGFDATTFQVENGGRDLDITVPQDIIFTSGSDEAMRILSGGNVGIGTDSPDTKFHVSGGNARIAGTETAGSFIDVNASNTGSDGASLGVSYYGSGSYGPLKISTGGSERMRIDSSGNVLVGKTATGIATVGAELKPTGELLATVSGDACAFLNRTTSQGTVIDLRNDNTARGSIDINNDRLLLRSSGSATGLRFDGGSYTPFYGGGQSDNGIDIGSSGARYKTVFAGTSSINTSDENEKQNVAVLTDAEITAAKAISKLFKTYKWKDAVSSKGDAARTHAGVIAQQVQTAMSDAGLDASKYGFWCSDTWWETKTEVAAVEADEENGIEAQDAYTDTRIYKTEDEAPEGATERTRLGIRYAELLSFIGAATEQRLTSIESRLDALEAG